MDPLKIDKSFENLNQVFAKKLLCVFVDMQKAGYDPCIFEGRRSIKRQQELYSIGRTKEINRKPVTWTMKSKHLVGCAADIISKLNWWSSNEFYEHLGICAIKHGLHRIDKEKCHLEL